METCLNPENNNNNDFNLESERTSLERQLSESSESASIYRRNSAVSLLGNNQNQINNSCRNAFRNAKNQKLRYLGKSSLPDLKNCLHDEYYIGRPSVIRKSCKIAN